MKKILLCTLLISTCLSGKGQNLVPNPGFELYSGCPTFYTQIDCVLFWMNTAQWPGLGGSPDYFNACAPSGSTVDVPDNIFGYQNAHSGDAYCGIILWDQNNLFREYIQVPLLSTLNEGCYHFEMHINLANEFKYFSEPIGVYFTNSPITGIPNFLPLPVTPQLTITGFTTDTLNWTIVSGDYTALGNENYMIIGNFNDDASTIASQVNSTAIYDQAYIFIDDVSLTECPPTSLSELHNNSFVIHPNPITNQELQIQFTGSDDHGGVIEMFDISGRKIYDAPVTQWSYCKLSLPKIAPGIYQCIITNGSNRIKKSVAIMNE